MARSELMTSKNTYMHTYIHACIHTRIHRGQVRQFQLTFKTELPLYHTWPALYMCKNIGNEIFHEQRYCFLSVCLSDSRHCAERKVHEVHTYIHTHTHIHTYKYTVSALIHTRACTYTHVTFFFLHKAKRESAKAL
jgi:hypothetical protein